MALKVEYDGTGYQGFQLQGNQPTIQGALEQSLMRFTTESIRIRAASRTDSGAHAVGQVVDFLTSSRHPVRTFPAGLNFYLPEDIRVLNAYEMSEDFHCRKDATSRIYRYTILNRQCPSPLRRKVACWVRESLDINRMAEAVQYLVGTHEFQPLSATYPVGVSTVRTVYAWNVRQHEDCILIECQANGFLRHQIRRANGLLVEIGKGKLETGYMRDLLQGQQESPIEWPSLPAHGLCLMKVTYPDFWSKVRTSNETEQYILP